MAQTYLIEVAHKAGVTDPVGKGLTHDIAHLGLARVKGVSRARSSIKVSTDSLSADDRTRIAEDLLVRSHPQ